MVIDRWHTEARLMNFDRGKDSDVHDLYSAVGSWIDGKRKKHGARLAILAVEGDGNVATVVYFIDKE